MTPDPLQQIREKLEEWADWDFAGQPGYYYACDTARELLPLFDQIEQERKALIDLLESEEAVELMSRTLCLSEGEYDPDGPWIPYEDADGKIKVKPMWKSYEKDAKAALAALRDEAYRRIGE